MSNTKISNFEGIEKFLKDPNCSLILNFIQDSIENVNDVNPLYGSIYEFLFDLDDEFFDFNIYDMALFRIDNTVPDKQDDIGKYVFRLFADMRRKTWFENQGEDPNDVGSWDMVRRDLLQSIQAFIYFYNEYHVSTCRIDHISIKDNDDTGTTATFKVTAVLTFEETE